MAGGFLKGLVHGAVLGGVALAGLSLLAPLPERGDGAAAPVVDSPKEPAPDAAPVGLPVGSEFGRGGDIAPRLPAPGSASPRVTTEPVAVPAPTAEPAPVALSPDRIRPETQTEDRMPAQIPPGGAEAAPGLTLPRGPAGSAQAPRLMSVPDRGADPDAAPRVSGQAGLAAPGLPAPVPDLSLPPDLTDLRRLERN